MKFPIIFFVQCSYIHDDSTIQTSSDAGRTETQIPSKHNVQNIHHISIAPIEQDTEENTRKSVCELFPKLLGRDKANDTKEELIY